MENIKKYLIILLLIIASDFTYAGKISLEYCVNKAVANSPINAQSMLIETSSNLEINNLSVNYFPSFSVDGQATYQSDVFSLNLNLPIPGFSAPTGKKDQYHTSVTMTQLLWDGGATSRATAIQEQLRELNKLSLSAKLYKIKEIINTLYFNILYLQENKKVLQISFDNLSANKKIIDSYVKNGAALKSSAQSLEIELIKINKNINSIESDLKANLSNLSIWTAENLADAELEIPSIAEPNLKTNRPEIKVIEQNQKTLDANAKMTETQLMPVFAAFVKGGLGNPNPLNMMASELQSFYIAGVKMSWTPFDWNKNSRKQEIIEINKQIAETEKSDLNRNIELSIIKDKSDIEKYNEQIKYDEQIVALQENIAKEKFAALTNESITATEYIVEFNKTSQAKVELEINRIRIINAKVNILNKTGNQ